ncbi:hypothetical protein AQUCO_07600033v1 [Aquilegia coerulea]|uniref:ATP-dependent RNA helicase n=1 Tax=Aquilegia coerulea TaxID=218851 RepID=A0A2G5C8G5_AQUCA|nr:hypothetical protein AQUCO_07600033v1 [Aquilegia coerulea]
MIDPRKQSLPIPSFPKQSTLLKKEEIPITRAKIGIAAGISILVATPGRLLDHLKNTASFAHNNLRWIIFDEADRILELGYGKEIEEILDVLGSKREGAVGKENALPNHSQSRRQNLLLSATLNEKVNHLANISLKNPVMIGIDETKSSGDLTKPSSKHLSLVGSDIDDEPELLGTLSNCSNADYNLPTQLIQRYVKVPCGTRLVALLSILKSFNEMKASQKVVVFFSTCDAVDFHYSLFSEFQLHSESKIEGQQKKTFLKYKTFRLHGNMEHEGRRTTFQGFKTEKSSLLLCTDVAARGLDFPNVTCIIQYDSPGDASEYVHRVGRTARLGEQGEALLFLQPVEMDYSQELQKHGVTLQEYPLLKVLDSFPLHDQSHHIKKFISIEMHPWVLTLQKALESFISVESKLKQQAKDAFCSWVRAYTAHRGELKRIFMVKKLHLGHVAKSFGLKDQPSLVGGSFQVQFKKRKKEQKQRGVTKRKKIGSK